jgi:hypothetical protein
VGNDGASSYVGSKVKACQESVLNLLWLNYQVPSETELLKKNKGVK